MNEPLASAQIQAQQDTLWDKAPAWRGLVLCATLLSVGALGMPLLFPDNAAVPGTLQPLEHLQSTPAVALPPQTAATIPAMHAQPAQRLASATQHPAQPVPAPVPPMTHILPGSLPAPQPQVASAAPQTETVCNLRQPATAPQLVGIGTITGVEDRAEALARIQVSEANSGGKIDPAYIDNTRVFVRREDGRTAVFIVPKGMQVAIGDRVTLQNGYRNMALPCNYVPVMIATDIGPAPPPGSGP